MLWAGCHGDRTRLLISATKKASSSEPLNVDSIRKIWKTEFLPNIKKEIRNELKTEIEKINYLITNLSKCLDSIESSQQLISDKYDSVLKSMQSTKKKMNDLNNKYKFLCNTSANIDFPNYKFYSTDSKTMAGGAGIYISSSIPKCSNTQILWISWNGPVSHPTLSSNLNSIRTT